jgi:hypothetical protein
MLNKLVYKVLGNSDGIKLLEELQKSLFHETSRDIGNTNDFVFVDGKRQIVRDLIKIIREEESKNE